MPSSTPLRQADFYYFSNEEAADASKLQRLFVDLHLRVRRNEELRAEIEVLGDTLERRVLDRTTEAIGALSDNLLRIVNLEFLTAQSLSAFLPVVGESGSLLIIPEDREIFAPSAWAVIQSVASTDYAIVRSIDYDRALGIYTFEVDSVSPGVISRTDWQISAVAGSTISQKAMLTEGHAARDDTVAALASAIAARNAALEAASIANAAAILIAGGPVSTVNGQTGAVVLNATDVGAAEAAALQEAIEDIADHEDRLDALESAPPSITRGQIAGLSIAL